MIFINKKILQGYFYFPRGFGDLYIWKQIGKQFYILREWTDQISSWNQNLSQRKKTKYFQSFLFLYSQLRKTAVDIDLSNIVNCAVLRSTMRKPTSNWIITRNPSLFKHRSMSLLKQLFNRGVFVSKWYLLFSFSFLFFVFIFICISLKLDFFFPIYVGIFLDGLNFIFDDYSVATHAWTWQSRALNCRKIREICSLNICAISSGWTRSNGSNSSRHPPSGWFS